MKRGRPEELEHYFKQFPDVPREVIVKEALISRGINFSEAAVRAAKDSPVVRGTLFTDLREKADSLKGEKTPDEIHIRNGPYSLKRTVLINRINSSSPYLVDVIDGQLAVCADGNPIADVEYPPRPD